MRLRYLVAGTLTSGALLFLAFAAVLESDNDTCRDLDNDSLWCNDTVDALSAIALWLAALALVMFAVFTLIALVRAAIRSARSN